MDVEDGVVVAVVAVVTDERDDVVGGAIVAMVTVLADDGAVTCVEVVDPVAGTAADDGGDASGFVAAGASAPAADVSSPAADLVGEAIPGSLTTGNATPADSRAAGSLLKLGAANFARGRVKTHLWFFAFLPAAQAEKIPFWKRVTPGLAHFQFFLAATPYHTLLVLPDDFAEAQM